jgi:adenylate cyclase
MADVFISYARPTASQAQRIEQAFQRMGYDVWRDSELPAHQAYSDVIEARLRDCRAVVVLWSADAAKSHWVRAEADLARTLGSLVQISLDDTPLPLPFNQIHSVDLRGWSGRSDDPCVAKSRRERRRAR